MNRIAINLTRLIKATTLFKRATLDLNLDILNENIKRLNLAINKVYKYLNYCRDDIVNYANYRLAKITRDSRVVKNL